MSGVMEVGGGFCCQITRLGFMLVCGVGKGLSLFFISIGSMPSFNMFQWVNGNWGSWGGFPAFAAPARRSALQ